MFTSAFQEVAVMSQRDAHQARTMQQLHEQLNYELERARVQHIDEVTRLRALADGRLGQLDEIGADLERAWLEAEDLNLQLGDTQARLLSSEARVQKVEKAR